MKRINYIDALRAFSMFLIVYSHLVHYGLQQNISIFNAWSNTFMVPLFFFISGFVAYNSSRETTCTEFLSKQLSKFRLLVLSPVLFLLLYCGFRDASFIEALGDPLKNGYWFTIVLFQISLIAGIVESFLAERFRAVAHIVIALLMMVGVFLISKFNSYSDHPNFTDYPSWQGGRT